MNKENNNKKDKEKETIKKTKKNNICDNKKVQKTQTQKQKNNYSKNTGVTNGFDLLDNHKLILEEYYSNGYNKSKAVMAIMDNVNNQSSAVHIFNAIASKPMAKKFTESIQASLRGRLHITREQTLQEFTNWSFTDATEFIGLTEAEVKELPSHVKRSIQSYKVTERTETDRKGNNVTVKTIDLKLVNKLDALKEATKIIGGYEIDNRQKSKTLDVTALEPADQLALLKILTKGTSKDDTNTIDIT